MIVWVLCIMAALTAVTSAAAPPNHVEVFSSGERKWALMTADLERAREAICIEYFHFSHDSSAKIIGEILMRKAQEGVPVRMILENVAHPLGTKTYYKELQKAGVEIRYFTDMDAWPWEALPGIGQRDHRKIVTIDGRVGFMGGMNLNEKHRLRWLDTHLRVEGPAVAELEEIFYHTWHRLGGSGEPIAQKPAVRDTTLEFVAGTAAYPVFQKRFTQTFAAASDFIYIQTPYFCPTDTILSAMKSAARRGVDVRLLVPEVTDHPSLTLANQSFFEELLAAGVRIFEYLPRFNHGKVIVADNLCWVGSVNLNHRSLVHDNELAARIADPDIAKAQKAFFLGLLPDSHEVTLEEVRSWTPWHRFTRRLPLILKNQL